MNPWICALLIAVSGALGGVLNALVSDNGFLVPHRKRGIWCPGFISNVLFGAFAAFASWSFYGSGAGVDLADLSTRTEISLRFSAIAGAFMVGLVGAKWLTSEADKMLLKESVKVVSRARLPPEECERLVQGSAEQVLDRIEKSA